VYFDQVILIFYVISCYFSTIRTCYVIYRIRTRFFSDDSLQSLIVRALLDVSPSHCPASNTTCCFAFFCIFSRRALRASPFFGQCTNECTAVLSLFIVSNRRYWCPRSLSWLIVAFSGRVALSVEAPSPTSGALSPPLVGDGAVQLLWVIECRRLVQSYSVAVASCQSFLATLRNWCAVCVCWLVGRAECNLCIISRRSVPAADGECVDAYLVYTLLDWKLSGFVACDSWSTTWYTVLLRLIPYVQFVCFIGVV